MKLDENRTERKGKQRRAEKIEKKTLKI